MVEKPASKPVHPLIEKAFTSKVPIADLIGFRLEEIGGGRAVSSIRTGPQHANPAHFMVASCATWRTRRWAWRSSRRWITTNPSPRCR